MALRYSLLIAFFLARFGTGQSATPTPTCSRCTVALEFDFSTPVTLSASVFYVEADAYQLTAAYEEGTTCITSSGSSTWLTPAFVVLSTATVNPSSFESSAASQFRDFLGLNGCGTSSTAVVLLQINGSTATVNVAPSTTSTDVQSAVPGTLKQTSLSLSSPLLTTTVTAPVQTTLDTTPSSSSLPSSSNLPTHKKVAIGVAIPVVVLALLLTVSILYYRRRKDQKLANVNAATSQDGDPKEKSQPYLQQKAELEAKENRKHELEAEERKHEMESEGERYELSAEEQQRESRRRQEP